MKAQQDARSSPGQTEVDSAGGKQGGNDAGSQQSSSGDIIPQSITSGDGKPPMRPSTPPLSVEDSQKLIDNVSKMPHEAQQHPQVQADVAQARHVVAAAQTKAEVGNADESHRSGEELSFDNEVMSANDISLQKPSEGSVTVDTGMVSHVSGAGAYPTIRWKDNPKKTPVRTCEQAEAIAKANGVNIPKWVKFRPVEPQFYGEDKWAQYCFFGPSLKHISWKDFLQPDGSVSIGIDSRLLYSDEGIVGVFAHEMHEVHALYEILRHGDSISLASLERLIQAPNGRLHQEAWNVSDKKINQMREEKYDPQSIRF